MTKGSSFSSHWYLAWTRREALQDILGLVGVTLALLVYGVLQERIMTVGFGPHKEMFEDSFFLVLCNRLVTCSVAFAYMVATGAPLAPAAPLHSYGAVSCSNVVATFCQYEALKYVSFALQTLGKSAKALPVMAWSSVISGKSYRGRDYVHALVITAGCTVFVLAGDVTSRVAAGGSGGAAASAERLYLAGAVLMTLYLFVDGLTSTWQDKLFSGYDMSICDQVLYTTAFSTLVSLLAVVGSGQLGRSLAFALRHPDASWWILALSLSSASVQFVISYTIKRYGAVIFATIMTTRQFFSILLSSALYGTPMTWGQWLGTLLVFGALYYKAWSGRSIAKPPVDRLTMSRIGNSLSPLLPDRLDALPWRLRLAAMEAAASGGGGGGGMTFLGAGPGVMETPSKFGRPTASSSSHTSYGSMSPDGGVAVSSLALSPLVQRVSDSSGSGPGVVIGGGGGSAAFLSHHGGHGHAVQARIHIV